jgi:DNA-binding response OmpR family regulator
VTFLVVVDEPLVRSLIRRAFESDGHACLTAGTVVDAGQVVAREHIDGIVLDLQVPGGNGLTWLEGVFRTRPKLARSTVVATVDVVAPPDRRRIANVGAVLLLKPFSLETLRGVFLDLIERDGRSWRSA